MLSDPETHGQNLAHFTTHVVIYRLPLLSFHWAASILQDNLRFYQAKYRFRLLGYVIMPDHMHTIIWPRTGTAISDIMRDFKKYTSVQLIEALSQRVVESGKPVSQLSRDPNLWQRNEPVPDPAAMMSAFRFAGSRYRKTRHKVWQDDFHDVLVWSPAVIRQKLNYIHGNPVRWGLVSAPGEWL